MSGAQYSDLGGGDKASLGGQVPARSFMVGA